MVIPSADAFMDDYQGQFVFVDEPTDDDAEPPLDECAMESTWPSEETQAYEGQLLDRRRDIGLTVDLTVFTDGRKAQIEPGTFFIIQGTGSCPGDWIGLEAESVPRRALVGEDPGPTVTPSDGSGFGVLAALAGAAGAAALRAFGDD